MKPIYHHLTTRLLLCLAALLTVTACQDDYIEKNAGTAGEGDKTTLRLIVPMTRTTSEATDKDLEGNEGYIRNLWLLAYPVVDGEGETLVQKLTPKDNALTHTYQPFDIQIKLGTYHMYVVANVDETFNSDTEEKDLQGIILKYRSGENGITLPNLTAGLPMVCEYQDIKLEADGKSVGETNNGNVEIQFGQQTTVYADLTFVCVKVRYTLVFDNSTGGASSAFGTNNIVRIDGIQAVKIPGEAPLLIHPKDNYTAATTVENITQNGEPVLTEEVIGNNYYFNTGSAFNSSTSSETYETFSYTSAFNRDEASSYAYRGTLYLPEHYVTAATQENQTELHISATLLTRNESGYAERATLKYTIELGDTQDQDDQTNKADKVRQLPRGRYYDITACITSAGDELEITAAVQDWKLSQVTAELNGPYFLQVEKTQIGVKAGEATIVNCSTDAPILGYESPTYNGIPIYKVDFHKEGEEYTSFTVTVNPEMPAVEDAANNTAIGKYIYIIANNLKKKIEISPLELDPYLIVTPASYTIYMKEIANLQSYSVQFTYETNLENIQITCDEYDKTDFHTTSMQDHIDYSFTFGETTEDKVFTQSKNSVSYTDRKTGILTCTLKDPYNQQSFPKNEMITFTYTASGKMLTTSSETTTKNLEETTTLTIIPNATTYRLHFRPLQYIWTNPHIYVYEPLYDKDGNLVFITGGNGSITDGNQDQNPTYEGENALMYSFTGKRTFLGWSSHGGTVTDPVEYKEVDGKRYWDGPSAALKYLSIDAYKVHTWEIDYSKDFRDENICHSCCIATPKGHNQYGYSGLTDGYNYKWPGVSMKKDPDNPGWFYYDLPLLAEPGKALIMFTEGHNGPDENLSDDEKKKRRYPAHMDPGVPLYNFADKDGWFLYDCTENQHEFIDDKPDYTCRIYIKTSLRFKAVHIWEENGSDHTKWPGIEVNYDGEKYYVDIPRILSDINTKRVGILCTDGQSTNVSGDNFIEINSFTDVRASHLKYDYVADIEITQ